MTKRKILVATIALSVLIIAGLVFSLNEKYKSRQTDEISSQPEGPGFGQSPGVDKKGLSLPPEPPEGQAGKNACDLFTEESATSILGGEASKNEKTVGVSTKDYNSTTCEYNTKKQTANVSLYIFKDEETAAENKDKVKKEALVISEDGRESSTVKREAVAEAIGNMVVVAYIKNDGVFDAERSNVLLNEAVKRL